MSKILDSIFTQLSFREALWSLLDKTLRRTIASASHARAEGEAKSKPSTYCINMDPPGNDTSLRSLSKVHETIVVDLVYP